MGGKTTRDEIDIDLNGSIDRAIKELQRLKKLYPKGRIELGSHMEYGEHYEHLRLHFTRPKEPVELEYDKWKEKLDRLSHLQEAARAYEREGDPYPRQSEIDALKAELGAWAADAFGRMGWLVISDGEVLMHDMMRGAYTRDGEWRWRLVGAEMYDRMLEGAASDSDTRPKDGDAKQGSTRE